MEPRLVDTLPMWTPCSCGHFCPALRCPHYWGSTVCDSANSYFVQCHHTEHHILSTLLSGSILVYLICQVVLLPNFTGELFNVSHYTGISTYLISALTLNIWSGCPKSDPPWSLNPQGVDTSFRTIWAFNTSISAMVFYLQQNLPVWCVAVCFIISLCH